MVLNNQGDGVSLLQSISYCLLGYINHGFFYALVYVQIMMVHRTYIYLLKKMPRYHYLYFYEFYLISSDLSFDSYLSFLIFDLALYCFYCVCLTISPI